MITIKKKAEFYCLIMCVLGFLLGPSCQCFQKKADTGTAKAHVGALFKDDLVLAFSSSLQGYIEPCGCTANPLGGIARLSTLLSYTRAQLGDAFFFIDTGDLLFEKGKEPRKEDACVDDKRLDLLLSGLHHMGMLFTVPNPRDLTKGQAFYDTLLATHQLPILQTPRLLKSPQGVLGIIPVEKSTLSFNQARENLQKQTNALKAQGAQAVVAISQLKLEDSQALSDDIAGLDVMIQAEDPGEVPLLPIRLNAQSPYIVSAGQQGQHVGMLVFRGLSTRGEKSLNLDDSAIRLNERRSLLDGRLKGLQNQLERAGNEEKISFFKTRILAVKDELAHLHEDDVEKTPEPSLEVKMVALSRSIEADRKLQKQVDAFNASIPELTASCEMNLQCPELAPQKARFVGAEVCKQCHQAAYDVWQKAIYEKSFKDHAGVMQKRQVGHAKAWATLTEAHKDKDRSCVGCHSVGFMQPGGYCKVGEVGVFAKVQCESCHGAGSLHAQSGDKKLIRREVKESVCRECHHVPHIESTDSFVYNDMVQKILGKGHGEALLKRLQHTK